MPARSPAVPHAVAQRSGAATWWRTALAAVAAGLLISAFGVGTVAVHGHSMQPTLHDGDVALVFRADAWLHRLGVGAYVAGDVVYFPDPTRHGRGLARWFGRSLLIKRIVAGPGERVGVSEGRLVVDGAARPEPYLDAAYRGLSTVPPLLVPEGEVYVLGDNRHPLASFDSRSFGPVPAASLQGRAMLVVWPLVRRGASGWTWNVHRVDESGP